MGLIQCTKAPKDTIPLTLYLVGYPWLELILQLRDTMSLRTADLGSVCARARSDGLTQTPQQSHPLSPLHEPLHGELNAIGKQKCFLCSPFHGRACRWAMVGELKPKGPKGRMDLSAYPFYGRARCWPVLGYIIT